MADSHELNLRRYPILEIVCESCWRCKMSAGAGGSTCHSDQALLKFCHFNCVLCKYRSASIEMKSCNEYVKSLGGDSERRLSFRRNIAEMSMDHVYAKLARLGLIASVTHCVWPSRQAVAGNRPLLVRH